MYMFKVKEGVEKCLLATIKINLPSLTIENAMMLSGLPENSTFFKASRIVS